MGEREGGNFSLSFNLFPFLCNFTISLTSLYIQILVRRTGGVRLGIFTYLGRGGMLTDILHFKGYKKGSIYVDYKAGGGRGEGFLGCGKINTIFNFGDQIFFYKWIFYFNSFKKCKCRGILKKSNFPIKKKYFS